MVWSVGYSSIFFYLRVTIKVLIGKAYDKITDFQSYRRGNCNGVVYFIDIEYPS